MSSPDSTGVNAANADNEISSLNGRAMVDVNGAYSIPDTHARSADAVRQIRGVT